MPDLIVRIWNYVLSLVQGQREQSKTLQSILNILNGIQATLAALQAEQVKLQASQDSLAKSLNLEPLVAAMGSLETTLQQTEVELQSIPATLTTIENGILKIIALVTPPPPVKFRVTLTKLGDI
jgi:hypothetical protein